MNHLLMMLIFPLLASSPMRTTSDFETQRTTPPLTSMTTTAEQALSVLQLKCNSCHKKRNPGKVFTKWNMQTFAPDIQKQVFVKERMPRGKDNKLNDDQRKVLRDWLDELGHTTGR